MADREKVIKDNAIRGLQSAIEISGSLVHLRKEHAKAILAMLKEQKPVEAELEGGGSTWWYVCGDCHGAIDERDSYCKHCGRKIKHD